MFGYERLLRPPRDNRTATLVPYTTRVRSVPEQRIVLKDETHLPVARGTVGNVLTVEQYLPRIREIQTRDQPQQRGLARAGRPQQGKQLPVPRLDAHIVQRRVAAEALTDIGNGHRHRINHPEIGRANV